MTSSSSTAGGRTAVSRLPIPTSAAPPFGIRFVPPVLPLPSPSSRIPLPNHHHATTFGNVVGRTRAMFDDLDMSMEKAESSLSITTLRQRALEYGQTLQLYAYHWKSVDKYYNHDYDDCHIYSVMNWNQHYYTCLYSYFIFIINIEFSHWKSSRVWTHSSTVCLPLKIFL